MEIRLSWLFYRESNKWNVTSFPWVLISLEMKIIFHKLGFLTCRLAASWTICGQGLSLDSFSQMSFDDPGSQQFSDSATADNSHARTDSPLDILFQWQYKRESEQCKPQIFREIELLWEEVYKLFMQKPEPNSSEIWAKNKKDKTKQKKLPRVNKQV